MCDQCVYVAASEKGLRQHIRMKHKESQLEKMRKSSSESPLAISPIKDQGRVEPINHVDDEPLDGHQCEENHADQVCRLDRICDCSNPDCCNCVHHTSCKCFEVSEVTAHCDCPIVTCNPSDL